MSRVKKLEWVSNGGSYLDAGSVAGNYQIQLGGAPYCFALNDRWSRTTYPTLKAVKAAAQADYEQRILRALLTNPSKEGAQ